MRTRPKSRYAWTGCLLVVCLSASGFSVWNSPYGECDNTKTYHIAIAAIPKTFDPARSYSSDEILIGAQIYEPPYQYHYLKRPYTLVPLTAREMPSIIFYGRNGQRLSADAPSSVIVKTVYLVKIKPGIRYQPHPAFARYAGQTRELTADDYVYEIKRLASPRVASPIFGLMRHYLLGLDAFAKSLDAYLAQYPSTEFLDLRRFEWEGVKSIDRYTYQITVRGAYRQFIYWLAMNFFAPIPWEVDAYYAKKMGQSKNMNWDWFPVGTGPYYMIENNPNKEIVLLKNPYFHDEYYPDSRNAFKLPRIEKIVFSLDKETIPRWNKFLQGYYDQAAVSADTFNEEVKRRLKKNGVHFIKQIQPGVQYMAFNMLDPIVGGYSTRQGKLRQAISIILDNEAYISIFLNGRAIPAQGPIPPGVFGYVSGKIGINPEVYDWVGEATTGHAVRKPVGFAKKCVAEAGYPNGLNPQTGRPLILNYEVATNTTGNDKALFDWMRQQFAKLGIRLNIHTTLYNQFQERVRRGKVQLFSWAWLVDYPDPENSLLLVDSKNASVMTGGENTSNYANPSVDRLLTRIASAPNGSQRQADINRVLDLLHRDSPVVWQLYPVDLLVSHRWMHFQVVHPMAHNVMKYWDLDATLRQRCIIRWNRPIVWPLFVMLGACVILIGLLWVLYQRRDKKCSVARIARK